jgi:hypothetical protein
MAADCKSAGFSLRWFKSNPLHHDLAPGQRRLIPEHDSADESR